MNIGCFPKNAWFKFSCLLNEVFPKNKKGKTRISFCFMRAEVRREGLYYNAGKPHLNIATCN